MPSNEDLWRDMEERDAEDAQRYRVESAKKSEPRRGIDERAALERYNRDIAPVIARIKRAEAGLPITDNPLKNFLLRITGKDKLPEPVVIVNPNEGIAVQAGPTAEQVRQEMIEHPERFADLRKQAPEVKAVTATRKTAGDLKS